MVRTRHVFDFLTCKCASCHNGVQLFISHLATWLRTRRFSEPTFRPSRPTNHWKNIAFRDFPNISRTCAFFLLTLSLSIFYFSLFYSSVPSDSSDLCFSSLHIVGSLTSKFPLIIPIDSMSQFAGFCMFVFWLSFVLAAKFLHGASAWVASLQRNLVLDSDVEFWICRA